ncbi:unnamed protein product, partial [Mesorhabditis belari]|uniref:Uncharacterized protein n=1 Tax=Mesorhabditis belari TaxID=2138241 RepID=A0AAF3EIA6_9BILA
MSSPSTMDFTIGGIFFPLVTICFIGNALGLWVAWRTGGPLTTSCRSYLIIEHLLRILICIVFYYEIFCIFNKAACLGMPGCSPIFYFLNVLFMGLGATFNHSSALARFLLSVNRFLIIKYGENSFLNLDSYVLFQILIIVILPMPGIGLIQFLSASDKIFYNPNAYALVTSGNELSLLLYIYEGILVVLIVCSLPLDVFTYRLIRKNTKNQQNKRFNYAQRRLTIMVLLSHIWTCFLILMPGFFIVFGKKIFGPSSSVLLIFAIKNVLPTGFIAANGLEIPK